MDGTQTSLPGLPPRLRAIAGLVPSGSRVADVGTDHAYIPVYLVLTGICPSAIAGDISEGPLENARRTVEKYGLADKIRTILSPGLDRFAPGSVDAVVIAGMGGDQIGKIVKAAPWLRSPEMTLIVQPMSMQEKCRVVLNELSFACEKEVWVEEGRRRYVAMRYRFNPESLAPLDELTAFVGTALHSEDPLAKSYLRGRADKLRRMLEGMTRSPRLRGESDRCRALLAKVEAEL